MKRQHLILALLFVMTLALGTAWGKNKKPTSTVITDCTTISQPGSYVLGNVITANPSTLQPAQLPGLDFHGAACILIASDFVTLDLGATPSLAFRALAPCHLILIGSSH